MDEDYDEFTCWVCDATATPIYNEAGEIVGGNCHARCDDRGYAGPDDEVADWMDFGTEW